MKNLKLHKSSITVVDGLKDSKWCKIIASGELCYSTDYVLCRSKINDRPLPVLDLTTTHLYTGENVKIVMFAYNALFDSFIVCVSNGDVLMTVDQLAEVAFCTEDLPVDIVCSPDFQRVVLLDSNGKITLVNDCFEDVTSFNVTEVALAEKTLVNVGWGKKETQFHGSEGKDKRVVKEVIGDGNDADDTINICWRSDSSFFAIGYLNKVTNLRSIKIFNRDGVLQYISEPLPGVEAVLSWKTSNELISFPQLFNEKYYISFMEKNGLKHGDFPIPPNIKVKQLLWNHDSSILCMQCVMSDDNYLIFLSCMNYKWQIKKWMTVDKKIITAKWFPDNSLQLITVNGIYYTLQWTETLCTSSPGTEDWVAVVDYCSVLLTPFKQVIIPPPMFDVELTFDSPVDSVLYLPHNQNVFHERLYGPYI